jgi:L-lactate dehydrogenase complex protein LldG
MSSGSRTAILSALRARNLPDVASRSLSGAAQEFAEPLGHFAEVLGSVGGTFVRVESAAELAPRVASLEIYQSAKVVVSCVSGVGRSDLDLKRVTPHELEPVDLAIVRGELAVAENAAIWVTQVQPRALCFLAQHLVLVVDASSLVHNLHQAYERIRPEQLAYGTFISGPSKTADIEQSLVIGAHGPRSLHALLVGPAA